MTRPIASTLMLLAMVSISTRAAAQVEDLCSDRPDRAASPCTVGAGNAQIETSLVDWARTDGEGARSDELLFGDSLFKYGVTDTLDLRLALTPHVRVRERASGGVTQAEGVGDLTIELRQGLLDGGDSGLSFGVQPGATLPIGSEAVSQGDWSFALTFLSELPLGNAVSLVGTGLVEAAADEDGDGRHLAYGGVVALDVEIADGWSGGAEIYLRRDRDPVGTLTQATADVYLAWRTAEKLQFDVGAFVGLNADTPDIQLLTGATWRL